MRNTPRALSTCPMAHCYRPTQNVWRAAWLPGTLSLLGLVYAYRLAVLGIGTPHWVELEVVAGAAAVMRPGGVEAETAHGAEYGVQMQRRMDLAHPIMFLEGACASTRDAGCDERQCTGGQWTLSCRRTSPAQTPSEWRALRVVH
ncbi:hypothetical protein OBBRIDRAFT_295515 [Obba rivulosa]|uniref:Uncharacterized protein n=1 Tax=Obba rivulosa TaxID=1052685 RepID=A0A8E2AJC8_9APHY|nr:hypothetical protein OBBRIDRAFT_295515 [Obba rivulosa]